MTEYIDREGNRYRLQHTAHGWRISKCPGKKGSWYIAQAPYYSGDREKAEELLDDIAEIKGWEEVER